MALRPTPHAVVLVVVGGPTQVLTLEELRTAPVREIEPTDYVVVLDALGFPRRVLWSTILEGLGDITPPPTDEAVVTETGEAIVTHTGEAIII